MKKLLLIGAALFLATGTAHADAREARKAKEVTWCDESAPRKILKQCEREFRRFVREAPKICQREGKAAKTPEEKARYEECLKTGPCGIYIDCE